MFYSLLIIFSFSILQALVSSMLAIVLALPLAHFFYRFDFTGKKFFVALALMLCVMPTKLVALCISLFFGATGFTGIILSHLMLNIPFSFFILNSVYQKVDITLLWLAQDLGATRWQTYRDILFPLLRSTLVSLFLLLFLLHFASFSIPLILGNTMHYTPEIMMYKLFSQGDSLYTFVFWAIRLLIILPLFFVHNIFSTQKIKTSSVVVCGQRGKCRCKWCLHTILWFVYILFIFTITIGPLIALLIKACDIKVYMFFVSIFSFLIDPVLGVSIYSVILHSIFLALSSAILAVLFGFFLSLLECRAKKNITKKIISFITIITFIIGSVGVGIIFTFLSQISSFFIAVLCHVILNFAFAYRIIRAQMILYHPDIGKTAQAFGATPSKVIWTISLPFVSGALVKAFCVCFGLSLTEVGAGAVLQSTIGLTMPMAIRMYRASGNQEAVIGMSLILLGLVLFIAFFLEKK